MEAIIELAVAIVAGLVEAAVMLLQVVLEIVFHAVVFLFTALFSGLGVAQEKRQQRLAALKLSSDTCSAAIVAPPLAQSSNFWPKNRQEWIAIAAGAVLLVVILSSIYISYATRQKRITATKKQIEQLADQFINQVGQPNAKLPGGVLPDRDAWDHPCELFVDEWLTGTQIVIRSAGPDRETGTIDDLLAIRYQKAQAKAVGMGVLKLGVKAAKEKLKNLVPQKENVPPPK